MCHQSQQRSSSELVSLAQYAEQCINLAFVNRYVAAQLLQ